MRPQGGPVGATTAAGREAEYGGRLVPIGHMDKRIVLRGTFTHSLDVFWISTGCGRDA